MRKNAFFTGLFVLLLSQAVWAQSGSKMSFRESTHDFGNIKESDGSVKYKFVFTNTGKAPLIIEKVKASCGCTTPAWTKEPVLPGKTGFVEAAYNPRNRPGSFHKTLTITSNAVPNTQKIYIKGVVAKKPLELADEFRVKKGHLGLKYSILNMGTVKDNKPATKSFKIANLGDQPLTFSDENKVPAHVKVVVRPKTLQPKQKGEITVTYDGKARNDYGRMYDYVYLGTNDSKEPKKSIRVAATLEEYFPPMSAAEKAKAPKLALSEKSYNFGTIKEGVVVTHEFTFTNKGKEPLIIRKTKTSCGCTTSKLPKKTLAPGESTQMTVKFDSSRRSGNQYKSITVYSNDPANPVQRIAIRGEILAKNSPK